MNAIAYRLRPAVASDMPGLWEVRYAVTENTLAPGRISDETLRASIEHEGRGWVVEEQGRIQAFAIGLTSGNVWAMFVRPQAQGRGHGSRLHAALMAWFATQPVEVLWLSTGRDTRARAFYEKHGWRRVGPHGDDEWRYERTNPRKEPSVTPRTGQAAPLPSAHPSPLQRLDGHTIVSIDTPRLVIRGVRPQDLNDLMAVNGDDAVTRYLPYASWRALSDATQWFARMQALQTAGFAQQLVVEHKAQGRAVGTVLLFKFDAAASRVELGYVMSRALWRQGCTREALTAVCAHGFQGLGLRRIEAEVNPANEASCALLRSLGFQHEGTLRQRWVARSGVSYDTLMFACLRDAWRQGA